MALEYSTHGFDNQAMHELINVQCTINLLVLALHWHLCICFRHKHVSLNRNFKKKTLLLLVSFFSIWIMFGQAGYASCDTFFWELNHLNKTQTAQFRIFDCIISLRAMLQPYSSLNAFCRIQAKCSYPQFLTQGKTKYIQSTFRDEL